MGFDIARDDRRADRQGLGNRHAEPFGKGRHQQRVGAADGRSQVAVAATVHFLQHRAERRAAFEHVDDLLILPPPAPDHQQAWHIVQRQRFSHFAPQVKQQ